MCLVRSMGHLRHENNREIKGEGGTSMMSKAGPTWEGFDNLSLLSYLSSWKEFESKPLLMLFVETILESSNSLSSLVGEVRFWSERLVKIDL